VHVNACGPPDRLEHCDRDEDQVYRRVDQQQDEVLVVPKPNAVVNPRAVVIHPEHTNIANPAMMTPARSKVQQSCQETSSKWTCRIATRDSHDIVLLPVLPGLSGLYFKHHLQCLLSPVVSFSVICTDLHPGKSALDTASCS